jgi:hypothetical protein
MRLARLSAALLLLALAAGPLRAGQELLPPPAADEQARAEKLIKRLFYKEYRVITRTGYRALAAKLLDQAADTKDDPAAKYVLLREAVTLAASAGDLELSVRAADELTRHYQVSGAAFKAQAFEKAARHFVGAEPNKYLAQKALAAADTGLGDDDYEAAARLLKVATAAAKAARSVPLISAVQARSREANTLKAEFEKIKKTLEILKGKPDDPDANTTAGKYYCLSKGNWGKGLPYLARAGDEKLKDLAAKDLAQPLEAAAQIEVARAG